MSLTCRVLTHKIQSLAQNTQLAVDQCHLGVKVLPTACCFFKLS